MRDHLEESRVPVDAGGWLVRWLGEERPTALSFPLPRSPPLFCRGLSAWFLFASLGRFSLFGGWTARGAAYAFLAGLGGVASGGSVKGCETHSGEKKKKLKNVMENLVKTRGKKL